MSSFNFHLSSLLHKIILFRKFLLLLIDDLWCRMLGTSNFIQEDWHGRSKGEERSLRLIKLISHLWHGREFLNPISLVLGQGKASVTGSLASVNRMLAALLTSYKRARGSHQRRSSFPLVGITGWNCNKWSLFSFIPYMQQCNGRWELMQFPNAFLSHHCIALRGDKVVTLTFAEGIKWLSGGRLDVAGPVQK